MGLETLAQLRELVQTGVRRNEQAFRTPEDDWVPICFGQSAEGLLVGALDGTLFDGDERKDALVEFLRRVFAVQGVFRYAVLLNGYGYQARDDDPLQRKILSGELRVGELTPEQGRTETLWLVLGDPEGEEFWMADITFDEQGLRRAGPWSSQVGKTFESRFSDLNAYLRTMKGATE